MAGFDKGAPQSLIGAHCFLGKNLFQGKRIKTAVFSGGSQGDVGAGRACNHSVSTDYGQICA